MMVVPVEIQSFRRQNALDNCFDPCGSVVTRSGDFIYGWRIPSSADHISRRGCIDPGNTGTQSCLDSRAACNDLRAAHRYDQEKIYG